MRCQNSRSFPTALFGLIACNQCRIHRADRDASNPVRLEVRFRERLVHTALVGPESATALKEQRNAFEGRPLERGVALAGGSIGCHTSRHDRDSGFGLVTVRPRYELYASGTIR